MDLDKIWNRALQYTEIIRSRVRPLMSLSQTQVPYILLSESSINEGDTVVRKGEITVEKPTIILPPNIPQFKGFDFEEADARDGSVINFLLIRGVSLPSLKYDNQTNSLDIYEGKLSEALKFYQNELQQKEDVHTGLILGPEDCWQFSLLIFIGTQIIKNSDQDIKQLLDEFKKKRRLE